MALIAAATSTSAGLTEGVASRRVGGVSSARLEVEHGAEALDGAQGPGGPVHGRSMLDGADA